MTPAPTESKPVPVTWNDQKLLDAAGGNPDKLKALLKEAKQPLPSDMAVYQWYSRRHVSNIWRPRLVYALLRAGRVQFKDVFTLADNSPT